MYQPVPPIHHNGPINATYEKLEEKQRKKLDAAIISRTASLTKIHETFHLAEVGISYQSLHGYARKVRDQADKAELLEKTLADEIDIDAAIFKFIKRQTLEIMMHRDPNMLDVSRAATTMQRCQQFHFAATACGDVAAGVPAGRGTRATPRLSRQQLEDQERRDARWGRNEDGTPVTHEEHLRRLNRVANFVYGVNLPGYPQSTAPEPAAHVTAAKQDHARGKLCAIQPPNDPAEPGSSESWHAPSGESFPLSHHSPPDPSRTREEAVSNVPAREITRQFSDPVEPTPEPQDNPECSPFQSRDRKGAPSNDASHEDPSEPSDLPQRVPQYQNPDPDSSPCLRGDPPHPQFPTRNPQSNRPNLRPVRVREDHEAGPRGTIYNDSC